MDESDILGYNLFAYCNNNPVVSCDPLGLCSLAWSQGYQGPCPGKGRPGCMDNRYRDVTNEVDSALIPAAERGQSFRNSQNSTYSTNPIVSETMIYTKFTLEVFHNAPWDIKREEPWEETIGTPYPGSDVLIIYHDSLTTVQELGNYTYGYLGYNYGIPLEILYAGSYVAAGFPIKESKFNHEVYEDWPPIKKGYMAAK